MDGWKVFTTPLQTSFALMLCQKSALFSFKFQSEDPVNKERFLFSTLKRVYCFEKKVEKN